MGARTGGSNGFFRYDPQTTTGRMLNKYCLTCDVIAF